MTSTVAAPPPVPRLDPPRRPRSTDPSASSALAASISSATADGRSVLITVGGLFVLGSIALYAFDAAYGGTSYLLAGSVGLVLGQVVAWWCARTRQPVIVVAAGAVLAFFLFGGAVAVPDHALLGVLPSVGSVGDLIDGAVQGWARLITTTPPVGDASNLLVVPYLCAMVAGVVSVSVALRSRRPHFALLAPVAMLVLGILVGTRTPPSRTVLVVQGTVLGLLGVAWLAHVQRAHRRVDSGNRSRRRWVAATAVLVAAGVTATLAGDHVPGSGTRPRVVLRDYTEPEFDPSDHPSPLSGYRRFTNGEPVGPVEEAEHDPEAVEERAGWRATPLFRVAGLPDDQPIRLATLDTYDGLVYGVGSGPGSSGYFRPVGERIRRAERDEVEVTVEILGDDQVGYRDIWLPTVRGLTSLRFEGDPERSGALEESLRVNIDTNSAAVPVRLAPGDRYTMTLVVPDDPSPEELSASTRSSIESTPDPISADGVRAKAQEYAERVVCEDRKADYPDVSGMEEGSLYAKVRRIADNLRVCGGLSDGRSSTVRSDPGHGAARLDGMLGDSKNALLGNGEQFAPLAALMSHAVGAPTRVVMGFRSKAESNRWREEQGLSTHDDVYEVMGVDVSAWIEVAFEGHGWVPILDVTPTDPEPQVRPAPRPLDPENDPPPPPPSLPPGEEDVADTERLADEEPDEDDEGFTIPGWVVKVGIAAAVPSSVVVLFTAVVGGLKSRRRTRRRTSGSPDARVNGGWDEITDLARDLGAPVPPRVTRREAATLMVRPEVAGLARRADAVIFGPGAPSDSDVERYWDEVHATRVAMVSDLSRFGRWKALVSLSSLLASSRHRRVRRRLPRVGLHLPRRATNP